MKKKMIIVFCIIIVTFLAFVVKDVFFTPLVISVKSVEISKPKLSLAAYGIQESNTIVDNTNVAVVSLEFYNPSLLKQYSMVDIKVYDNGGEKVIIGNNVDMGGESGLIGTIKPSAKRNCNNVTILLSNKNEDYLLQEISKAKFVATGIVLGKRQIISQPFSIISNSLSSANN